jgi:tetratricopeptide (TPR) repeat protein
VSSLLIGLLSVAVATNQAVAVSNLVTQATGISVVVPDPNDPVEQEFKKLEADDDAAQAEVDSWIKENIVFTAKGAGIPAKELNRRIMKRFESVRTGYEDFIKRHPNHVGARLAYASFLDDIGDEEGQVEHLEKARELDPKDPAVWNQLANYYGHNSPVTKAFEYYEKAIELNPKEPVYYQNFATTTYLFRKDAMEHYHITEPQVFDKSLDLYAKALSLDPTNFPLATDLAQSYYGIKPLRTNDALQAWTNTLSIATDEVEREGVYIHLARIKLSIGRYEESHAHLNAVTNEAYAELKNRIARNLAEREHPTKDTNSPQAVDARAVESKEISPSATKTNAPPENKKD